jgi:hypothetical protein
MLPDRVIDDSIKTSPHFLLVLARPLKQRKRTEANIQTGEDWRASARKTARVTPAKESAGFFAIAAVQTGFTRP